jgi:hypothetical protein
MTYGSIIKTDLKDHSQGSPSPLQSERSEVSESGLVDRDHPCNCSRHLFSHSDERSQWEKMKCEKNRRVLPIGFRVVADGRDTV